MVKNVVLLVFLSILAVFFRVEIGYVVHGALKLHDLLVSYLSLIFSGGRLGQLIELGLALFLIPSLITGISAGLYWLFKRTMMPFFNEIIWVLWFVLLTALVLQGS